MEKPQGKSERSGKSHHQGKNSVENSKEPISKSFMQADPHKLKDNWVFWYLVPSREKHNNDWRKFLNQFHEIMAIEDFFLILNSIRNPSEIPKGCRYYIFRKGVKPIWEDPSISNGFEIYFEWQLTPNKTDLNQQTPQPVIDEKAFKRRAEECWRNLVLSVIGQDSDFVSNDLSNHIKGIEFNNRGPFKVGIWTDKIETSQQTVYISAIKKLFNLEPTSKIEIKDISAQLALTERKPSHNSNMPKRGKSFDRRH